MVEPFTPNRSENRYKDLQDKFMKRGGWVPVPLALIDTVGRTQALLLSYLIMVGKASSENGWIWMTEGYLERGTGLNAVQQDSHLKDLERKGYIEISISNKIRRIRVDCKRMLE